MPTSPLAGFVRRQARQRLHAVRHQIHSATHHPEDPEAIHDLRVAIRRFTQSVRAFRTVFDDAPLRKLRRRLHRLMDLCGEVRTCDVALEVLKGVGISGAARSQIRARRAEAEGALRHTLSKQHRHHADWKLKLRVGKAPARDWEVEATLGSNLSRVLPRLAEEYFAAGRSAAAATGDPAALHGFRLETKHFRYTLELFGEFYDAEFQRGLKDLKGAQDRLGGINDCVTILPLLEKDKRAGAAVRRLLRERVTAFAAYWKRRFPDPRLAWWEQWLGNPVIEPDDL